VKDKRAFEILSDIAWELPKVSHVRISSMLVLKNEILSFGFATLKSHPFQKKYRRKEETIYLHSEVSSIHRALKRSSLEEISKSTLYICRVRSFQRKDGSIINGWGLSYPCTGCLRCITEFDIKRVVYTLTSDVLAWQEIKKRN